VDPKTICSSGTTQIVAAEEQFENHSKTIIDNIKYINNHQVVTQPCFIFLDPSTLNLIPGHDGQSVGKILAAGANRSWAQCGSTWSNRCLTHHQVLKKMVHEVPEYRNKSHEIQ
jgi:hypothetical protein